MCRYSPIDVAVVELLTLEEIIAYYLATLYNFQSFQFMTARYCSKNISMYIKVVKWLLGGKLLTLFVSSLV